MFVKTEHYIEGCWIQSCDSDRRIVVLNPATEEAIGIVGAGTESDVDAAVKAARKAFPDFAATSREDRVALIERVIERFTSRVRELAATITAEMGSPISFAYEVQTLGAISHFRHAADTLRHYPIEWDIPGARIVREPIGVCGLITAWNWPLALIATKLAYALAAGCTIVLKPSELAPLSAMMLADILDDAGVPRGVFNLVNGDGPTVGHALAAHPGVDMISFTGSTRAGILVAKAAADSVKRVHQELGGKSANIVLPDADLEAAVSANIQRLFANAGQSCQAPTRMLIHQSQYGHAIEFARAVAEQITYGDPTDPQTFLGPVVSEAQFRRVQDLIEGGMAEGARLITGGLGRPDGIDRGYFVKPTIFGDVSNQMTIARTEIFGPVLAVLGYSDVEEAIEIANDSPYGLAAYVQSGDIKSARKVASNLRAGRVYINTMWMGPDQVAPFGGYKQSGNGREQGQFGLDEYFEVKAIIEATA